MKKTKGISSILAVVLILTIAFPSAAFAAEKSVVKEYIFTTDDGNLKNMKYTDNQSIKIDGKKYKAVKTEYKIIHTKKKVTKKVTYNNLTEKEVPKTIKRSGKKLTLKDVKWTDNRRSPATGTLTYQGEDNKPDAPKTTDITASLPDGKSITVPGELTNITRSGGSYSKPFTIRGKFTGDEDVAYYMLGNTRWPNNPDTPAFEGYETAIATALGLGDSYKLTSAKWAGDYKVEDGQTVRYATFSGLRQSTDWVAHYQEQLTADSPSLTTYNGIATYTNGLERDQYEVAATVTYEKVGLTIAQIIKICIGLALIAGLFVLIMYVIRKKKTEKTQ